MILLTYIYILYTYIKLLLLSLINALWYTTLVNHFRELYLAQSLSPSHLESTLEDHLESESVPSSGCKECRTSSFWGCLEKSHHRVVGWSYREGSRFPLHSLAFFKVKIYGSQSWGWINTYQNATVPCIYQLACCEKSGFWSKHIHLFSGKKKRSQTWPSHRRGLRQDSHHGKIHLG